MEANARPLRTDRCYTRVSRAFDEFVLRAPARAQVVDAIHRSCSGVMAFVRCIREWDGLVTF
jgi:hypothetical protein